MADRRSWEYSTHKIVGDLAQLDALCVDGWRLKQILEKYGTGTHIVLLEREKSAIIT
jgi:hypothetical protein